MAQRVFLSYAREDATAVDRIRAVLEADGHSVWLDTADVPGGTRWRAAIVTGIEQADAVVVVLSVHSVVSQHVLAEVQIASEQHTPIVPIRLDDAKISGGLRYTLVGLQIVDVRTDTRHGLAGLREALGSTSPPLPPPPSASQWWKWVAGGVAVLLLAVLVVALWNRSSTSTIARTTSVAPPPSTTIEPATVPVEPIIGQRVNAEELVNEFGPPVLALNFGDQSNQACDGNKCSYPGGFVYETPPQPAVFPSTPTCERTNDSAAFDGPDFLPIRATEHDEVFWTYKWGNVGYELDVQPGTYFVVLRFAEIDHPNKPEKRRFTAAVQGMEADLIDVERKVGIAEALDLGWRVEIGDGGVLNVRLIAGDANCPLLNALVVFDT